MKSIRLKRREFISKSTLGLMCAGSGMLSFDASRENSDSGKQVRIKDYRILGRTGFRVSDIGCGPALMTSENLLKAVIDSGVNIIDTAEFYNNGNNELLVGRAVSGIDRKSIFLNTKLIISENDKSEMIIERVRKCLERLNTEYIDGMMLWNPASAESVKNSEFQKAFEILRSEGRARFCGISCHGNEYPTGQKDNMERIICGAIEDGRFDHVLFVYNYGQQEMGKNILKECEGKNVGAILMKTDPFGKRYLDVIEKVNKLMAENKQVDDGTRIRYEEILEKQRKGKAYLAEDKLNDINARREAAINFVLDNRSVSSVLISFSNFDEIEDYVSLSGGKLTVDNNAVIRAVIENLGFLYCRHACGICEAHCPHKVPVNTIARLNHYFISQKREKYAIQNYLELGGSKTEKCLDCDSICEASCPYGVSIQNLMTIAHENLHLNMS